MAKPLDCEPHSLECERAVLGALLLDAAAWHEVAGAVSRDDFYRVAHAEIYQAMARLVAAQQPIDLTTVARQLGDRLEAVGGRAYLAGLIDGVPRVKHAERYAALVRRDALRRLIRRHAAGVARAALAEDADPATIAAEAARQFWALSAEAGAAGTVTAREAEQQYVASLESDGAPVRTGFTDLDMLIGGLRPGDLTVVAARPGTGKSSWALGVADYLAQNGEATALLFTLEMSARRLAARRLAWRSGVRAAVLERGRATDEEIARVASALQADAGDRLLLCETARTLADVATWCERVQQRTALGVVVVDYLQLVQPGDKRKSREEEVAMVARGLKDTAKRLAVPLVAVAQLSRAPEGRRDKRPRLGDLRESGAIEQDADQVLFLFREELYQPTPERRGIAELIVAKNRDGPVGVVQLQFDADFARFRNLEHDHEDII